MLAKIAINGEEAIRGTAADLTDRPGMFVCVYGLENRKEQRPRRTLRKMSGIDLRAVKKMSRHSCERLCAGVSVCDDVASIGLKADIKHLLRICE